MKGKDFVRLVRQAFTPFLENFGFKMGTPSISGRLYCVDFTTEVHTISLSYEPGDKALFVVVSSLGEGLLADYDNKEKSPRLTDLNARYMKLVTVDERAANDDAFSSIVAEDEAEHRLLKAAKELRLVLPKFLKNSPATHPR